MLERVKIFANEILEQDDINSRKDTDSEGQDEQQVNVPDPTSTDHEELMRNFKSVANSTSSELLQNVWRTSMCLEKSRQGKCQGRSEQCSKGEVSCWKVVGEIASCWRK